MKTSKVDLSHNERGMLSMSAVHGISPAECVQMVSAADAKLTTVL